MKRIVATLAALVTVLGIGVTSIPAASANGNCVTYFANRGTGVDGDPYLVSSQLDLEEVRFCLSSHFLQTSDITLIGDWTPIGGYHLTDYFTGVFDGGNRTISGLTNSDPNVSYFDGPTGFGLFRSTDHATLKNITLSKVDITADWDWVGGLVGQLNATTITNCHVSGNIDAVNHGSVGGIAGYSDGSFIRNSTAAVSVAGTSELGGIVGRIMIGEVTNVTVTPTIRAAANGDNVGGVVGWGQSLDVVGATVHEGTISGQDNVGGVVGFQVGNSANDSVVHATVRGRHRVGGLVGQASNVGVSNSQTTGDVEGSTYVGGLIGSWVSQGGMESVTKASATGNVSTPATASSQENIGGLIGYMRSSPSVTLFLDISAAHGNITLGNSSISATNVGGLVGFVDARAGETISMVSDYSTGTISGANGDYVGGLVGKFGTSFNAGADRVYSISSVPNGTNVGGLFGSYGGLNMQGFWNPTRAAPTNVSAAGTESTVEAMRTIELYSAQGWGINDGWSNGQLETWGICPVVNDGYPFLMWEYDTNPCVPGAPLNVVATAGDASASIVWAPPANGAAAAITKYEYRLGEGEWTNAGSSPLALTGLTNGTKYSVELRAVNSYGNGTASSAVNFTPAVPPTPAPTPDETQTITPAPTWPKSLKAPGRTVIFTKWMYTDAGQRVQPRVTFSSLRSLRPTGDVRLGKAVLTKKAS